MHIRLGVVAAATTVALTGCGAVLPVMDLRYADENSFGKFVHSIAVHVRCEMHRAVALEYNPNDADRRVLFGWAAKIALTIRAFDKGNLNPGISAVNQLGLFTLAAGGSLETNATREMTMTYYLPFDELLNNQKKIDTAGQLLDCDRLVQETGVDAPIAGNLGIHESLQAALKSWDSRNTLSERIKDGPFDTITHHVTFQIVAGATATPTWKLVRVTLNPSSPFASANRTTTNELLITMGPGTLGGRKELDESFSIERLRSVINSTGH